MKFGHISGLAVSFCGKVGRVGIRESRTNARGPQHLTEEPLSFANAELVTAVVVAGTAGVTAAAARAAPAAASTSVGAAGATAGA